MNWQSRPFHLFTHVLLRVVPAAALVLIVVWYGSTRGVHDTVQAQIDSHLLREAQRSAEGLGRHVALMTDTVRSLAGNDMIANALIDTFARADYLVPFFRSLKMPGPKGGTVTFTDYQGRSVAAAGDADSYQGSEILAQVMKGETVVRFAAAGLTIAAPVLQLGRPEGMVVAHYNASELAELMRIAAPGEAIAAIDAGGTVIYSSEPAFARTGVSYPAPGPAGWLAVAMPVPGVPGISLVNAQEVAVAMAPARALKPYLALELALSLATLVIGIAVTALLVSRPLAGFISQLRQIGVEDDLARRVTPRGPIELHALADAFNTLLAHLEDTTTSQAFVESIISSMGEFLIVTDSERRIQIANLPARQLLSDGEEVVGLRLDDLPLIAASVQLFNYFANLNKDQRMVAMCGRASDGEELTVAWSRVPLSDASEEGFVFVGRDVTAQRMAEAALRDSEERLRSIFDTVIDGIITLDGQGVVESVNPAATRIFGYRPDQITRRNVSMLVPASDRPALGDYLQQVLTNEPPDINGGRETTGLRRDGQCFPIEIVVTAMEVGGGQHYTGVIRDITERRKMDRMKNEFISVISHELRTPLTSLLGSIGLIRNGAVGKLPEPIAPMVEIAHSNGERLLRLINDILDIEKIGAVKMKYSDAPVELADLIDHTILEIKGLEAEYNVRFAVQKHCGAIWVDGDKDRLVQTLTNLLSNAAKFSLEGGEVTLTLDRHDGAARIAVTDCGPGIPESFRDQIFGKFAQADASDTRRKDGTGLGLAICKAIVEHHGGTIRFESAAGMGTTFLIELPEAQAPTRECLSDDTVAAGGRGPVQ